MSTDNLSPELLEKLKACTTSEELKSLVEAKGFELSEDVLQAVAGGGGVTGCDYYTCPYHICHSDHCDELVDCDDFVCFDVTCASLSCLKYGGE